MSSPITQSTLGRCAYDHAGLRYYPSAPFQPPRVNAQSHHSDKYHYDGNSFTRTTLPGRNPSGRTSPSTRSSRSSPCPYFISNELYLFSVFRSHSDVCHKPLRQLCSSTSAIGFQSTSIRLLVDDPSPLTHFVTSLFTPYPHKRTK